MISDIQNINSFQDIDNILEQENIPLVTMENKDEGMKWGLQVKFI